MNIDVTATDGRNTWSEKFTGVDTVGVNSGSLAIYRDLVGGRMQLDENLSAIASFAPGAWHSWRRID